MDIMEAATCASIPADPWSDSFPARKLESRKTPYLIIVQRIAAPMFIALPVLVLIYPQRPREKPPQSSTGIPLTNPSRYGF